MSATHTEELKDSCLGQRVRVEPVPHSSSCTCSSEHTSSRVAIRIQRDVTSSLLGLTIGDGDFAEQVWGSRSYSKPRSGEVHCEA